MDFRQRFQAKLSNAVELSGDEVPINKELKASQMHDTTPSSFRSSAYSMLSQQSAFSSLAAAQRTNHSPLQPVPQMPTSGPFYQGHEGFPGMGLRASLPAIPSYYPSTETQGHSPAPHYPSQYPQYAPMPQFQQPFPQYSPQVPPQYPQYPQYSPVPQFPVQYPQHSPQPQFSYPQHPSPQPQAFLQPQASVSPVFGTPTPLSKSSNQSQFSSQPSSLPRSRALNDRSDVPMQLLVSRSTSTLQAVSHSLKRKSQRQAGSSMKSQLQQLRKAPPVAPPKAVEIPFSKKRDVDFSPYTYEDYLKVKQDSGQRLGGLGPANVNTKEWKDQTRRRIQASLYGKLTRAKNANGLQSRTFDF